MTIVALLRSVTRQRFYKGGIPTLWTIQRHASFILQTVKRKTVEKSMRLSEKRHYVLVISYLFIKIVLMSDTRAYIELLQFVFK